jgi:hypothetical protein
MVTQKSYNVAGSVNMKKNWKFEPTATAKGNHCWNDTIRTKKKTVKTTPLLVSSRLKVSLQSHFWLNLIRSQPAKK